MASNTTGYSMSASGSSNVYSSNTSSMGGFTTSMNDIVQRLTYICGSCGEKVRFTSRNKCVHGKTCFDAFAAHP